MIIHPAKYAREREKEREKSKGSKGFIVTISREFGCPAKIITKDLISLINKSSEQKWTSVSKEILAESAKTLGIPPSEIKYFFEYHEQGVFDGILNTIAKFYISDRKIYSAVEKAISSIGNNGNVVIVGRGGAAICKDFNKALHVRLMAPLDWRIEKVMEYYKIGRKQAVDFVQDYDSKRQKFISHFSKEGLTNSLFDVIYNCKSFSKKEIVQSIFKQMKTKKLIK